MGSDINKPADLCKILRWDSDFFRFPVAQVCRPPENAADFAAIDGWCNRNHVHWLNFIADPSDSSAVALAERNGYHLADVRMTYHRYFNTPIPPVPMDVPIRLATDEDVEPLCRIASESHGDSRFYQDGHLAAAVCDELFATWIRNSCHGFADAVLVGGAVGKPLGYVTGHLDQASRNAKMGLMAVDRKSQNRNLGWSLGLAILHWVHEHGADRATLVTQGRNIVAQRLYQRLGFSIRRMELHYHKWYESVASETPLRPASRPATDKTSAGPTWQGDRAARIGDISGCPDVAPDLIN